VIALVGRGVALVRARLKVLVALYALQLAVALIFTVAAALALGRVYARRPLFAQGVAGDDLALLLALQAHTDVVWTLAWVGAALAGAWMLASLYLSAGLLGALAGRGFAATAAARLGGFVRLALSSLHLWLVVVAAAAIGLRIADVSSGDIKSLDTVLGRPLLALAPALLLAAITCLAIDLARADLVLAGGGGSFRALLRGLRRALTRPRLLGHFLLYVLAWIAVSALYVAATHGRDFPGAGGAWLLVFMRQITAVARFLARAVTSAGQLAALQLDVVEVRQVVERPEPRRDVVQGEHPQPVQREALDGE
jgi:hypothetical protein